jgi:hypothetical protein
LGLFNFFSKRKKIENSDLEKVMSAMSVRPDMKARRVLYAELLKSTLLLPTPSPLEASSQGASLKEIQLVTQPGPQNELVWIAFTNKAALRQWRPQLEEAYVAIRGIELFALAVQNRVESMLINPAGPIGGKITGMELQMLAEGTFPQEGDGKTHTVGTKEQASVRIGTPAVPLKAELVEYLQDQLGKNGDVLAGYVAAMVIGSGAAHLVLGIEFASGSTPEKAKPIMDSIGVGIHSFLGNGEYLDMIVFDAKHEWNESIKKLGIVVYRRP